MIMLKVKVILIVVVSALCLVSCSKKQEVGPKHYTYYYDAGDKLLGQQKLGLVGLYVDSIRNHSRGDTAEIVEAYANMLQAWCDVFDLDDEESARHARSAYEVLSQYESEGRYDKELSGLASLLSYSYMVTKPDSTIYFSDVVAAKVKENPERLVGAYIYKAEAYRNLERFEECLETLDKIQAITDTVALNDMDEGVSWMLYSLTASADIACFVGDYRRCNNYLASAARWYDITQKVEDRLSYLESRARVFFVQAQYSLASSYANRLNHMAIANGEEMHRVNALTILGLTHCRNNEIDKAFECKAEIDSIIGRNPRVVDLVRKERILLDGELAAYGGDLKLSHALLFDSIRSDVRTFEFDLTLRSQQVYYLVQEDYKRVYQLERERKAYVDSIQTTVIYKNEQNQVRMSRDITERLRAKVRAQAEAIELQSSTLMLERMIFAGVVLIVAATILFAIRRHAKERTRLMAKEKRKLESEIADKIKALEQQKEMFQRTNKRISDSIAYAERIQHSIMPPPEKLNELGIEGSFIFNSPLDVVSGDFYWFGKKGKNTIVACADCTGHGIPGAFMSMIASTTITEVVDKASDDVTPAEILESLDDKIISNLAHNRTDYGAAKDGLDIGLVSINTETCEVTVSAARRPIIITKDQEVITYSGTKRSIGDVEPMIRKRKFENAVYQLHRGDTIYMYSDGYSDQFGGADGDKMKNSKIMRFVRAIHDDDIDEQSLTIQELFTQWKGDYPQTDDVLFIGLKL